MRPTSRLPRITSKSHVGGARFGPIVCRLALLVSAALLAACHGTGQPLDPASIADRFSVPGEQGAPSKAGSFERNYPVVRNGSRRDSMILVAPVTAAASLVGINEDSMLEGAITPVFNIGDGIQLDIFIREGNHNRPVYTRYFDAGRNAQDRAWIPLSIPLHVNPAQGCDLVVQVSAGPQGDLVGDWLAMASLRIVQRTPTR